MDPRELPYPLPIPPAPQMKITKKIMTLHTQRGQFLLDISAILHGIGMGVCFNEIGTSKCTSGANYICISVLRVTQGSYCHMRPVYKGSSDQAPSCSKLDSAIQLLNNWGQYNWTGKVTFIYMRPASRKYK